MNIQWDPIVFLLSVLGWAVLHLIWQGLILGVVAEILLLGLRRGSPRFREWVAGSALVMLVAAFVGTGFKTIGGALELGPASLAASVAPPPGWLSALAPWVGGAWLLVASFLLVRLLRGIAEVGSLRVHQVAPAPAFLAESLERLASRMGIERRVPLLVSSRIEAPALVGWRTPVILLPGRVVQTLPPGEIEPMLAHELAHLRRWDRWTKAGDLIARSLLFFHPVAHRLLDRMDVERERACDDLAVAACGSPVHYARALASLEHARGSRGSRVLAADGAPLLARIRRIVEPGARLPDRTGRGIALAGMGTLAFLAGSMSWACAAGPCLPDAVAEPLLTRHVRHHSLSPQSRQVILDYVHELKQNGYVAKDPTRIRIREVTYPQPSNKAGP